MRSRFLGAATVAAIFSVSAPIDALQITGLSITTTGNSANSLTNSGNNRMQVDSATNTVQAPGGPVADTPGSFTDFLVRYASLLAADREQATGSTAASITSSYQITFTVNNPTAGNYRVDIDTLRIGALTNVDDLDLGSGSLTLGAVTGSVGGINNANLTLAAVGPYNPTATGVSAFNQSSTTLQIFDNAILKTFVLGFTWTGSVSSARDEVAIRMGRTGGLSTTTADDYPGVAPVGPRTQANDGHFTDVTVTYLVAVPESGTSALLLLGLLGLGSKARFDQRARRRGRHAA